MKYGSRTLLALALAMFGISVISSCDRMPEGVAPESALATDTMRLTALRRAALANGFVRAADLEVPTDPRKVAVGGLIFDSSLMSVNGSIACRDCHLDEFGSADGLPNAIGVGAQGKGAQRMGSGGRILPRNALPFWGRGGKGFKTFFWDGKVTTTPDGVVSQFGDRAPSIDPLTVAIHLPSVELREMVADTQEVQDTMVSEDVATAQAIQFRLANRFARDTAIGPRMAAAYGLDRSSLEFSDIADALTHFIRHEFRIRPTPLERFVFDGGRITDDQLAGGLLFYGRGRCSSCHNGPYFSDQSFHAVAFPQAGFGKNGFGIDEGRYNITLDPKDRFLFRTPPLHNVTLTAPYSHSGSVKLLSDAVIAHFDPLRLVDTGSMSVRERTDLYARLGPASRESLPSSLTDKEVRQLVAYMHMLEFKNR